MSNLIKNISETFLPKIRIRGKRYFKEGKVKNVEISENFVSAKVKGSETYHVWIAFDEDLMHKRMSCTCPYFETDNCKHLAALFYYLDANNYFISAKKFTTEKLGNDKDSDSTEFPIVYNREIPDDKSYNDLIVEREFKNYFDPLINDTKKQKKSSNIKYDIAYGISSNGYLSEIFPLRLRLRNDGSIAEKSRIYNINHSTIPVKTLEEKLIIDYLIGYGNNSIYLGERYRLRDDLQKRQMFNDILYSFPGKKVYFQFKHNNFENVEVLNESAECEVIIDENITDLILKLSIIIEGKKISKLKDIVVILDEPLWLYAENKIFKVNNLKFGQFELFANEDFKLFISKDYLSLFEKELLPKIVSKLPIVSNKYEIEEVNIKPVKKILLEESDSILLLKIKFGYGNIELPFVKDEKFATLFTDNKIYKIKRDNDFENSALDEIKKLYVKKISEGVFTPRKDPIIFLFEHFSIFKEMDFEILGEEKLKKLKINTAKPKVTFNVTSGIDWFDVKTEVNFNGTTIPFSELVEQIKQKKKYLTLSDGSSGIIPTKWIKKFQQTLSFGKLENDSIRFSKIQALALEAIIDDADDFETDEKFTEHINKLKSFEKIKQQNIPRSFKGKLRDYQKSGLDWLYFLKEYSFGGILADDMGLGKTIQSIALLLKEKKKNSRHTNLIVAPTSVVFNWIDEIKKFAPVFKVLNHTGIERERNDNSVFNKYDIVITSYGLLLRDFELLKNYRFHYIILDESQKIKNPVSKTGRVVRKLKSNYRLCLTGTPIENNLTELWSQMAFLNPGLLGSFKSFNDTFVKVIQREEDQATLKLLKKTIYPFVLRRTKEVVAKDLPVKTETIHYCEMEKEQERIYTFWKNSIKVEILKEIETKGIKKSGFKILEGLLRLRQICNHPLLVDNSYKKQSVKFEEFKMMLTKVISEGHKVLVFSQFVQMLEIMRGYLEKEKIKYELLTGRTRKREERVKNFKENDDIKIFLISLKAGGFGLNLTEADYVFHYDPWWNPAVELQATDRTHRIGQDKNVFVYKFITKNTIEEKILQLQKKKQKLVSEILSTETSLLKNLTKEDINILFE